jgi:hypothetical protein
MASLASVEPKNLSSTPDQTPDQSFTVKMEKISGPGFTPFKSSIFDIDPNLIPQYVENEISGTNNLYQITVTGNKCKKEQSPIDSRWVLDASESMDQNTKTKWTATNPENDQDTRLNIAKRGIITACKFMHDGDFAALNTFSDTDVQIFGRREMTPENKKTLIPMIEGVHSIGLTNLGASLMLLLEKLQKKEGNEIVTVVIFSDGRVNRGPTEETLVEAVKKAKNKKNMSLYVISIGPDTNDTFLEKLANAGDGTFYHIDGCVDSMSTTLGSIMGGERGVVASDISMVGSSELKSIFPGPFQVVRETTDNDFNIKLNNLQVDEEKVGVFALDGTVSELICKGFDANTDKYITITVPVQETNDCTKWFDLKMVSLIDSLLLVFNTDIRKGKANCKNVLEYMRVISEKLHVDAEHVKEKKQKIEELMRTTDQRHYQTTVGKTTRAYTNNVKRQRSVRSGGRCKQMATLRFTKSMKTGSDDDVHDGFTVV